MAVINNKTILILTIIITITTITLISSANAVPGDLLFTINNPTPEFENWFGYSVASTPNGNIIVGDIENIPTVFGSNRAFI